MWPGKVSEEELDSKTGEGNIWETMLYLLPPILTLDQQKKWMHGQVKKHLRKLIPAVLQG